MILVNDLRGLIVSRGFSQRRVAKCLGLTEKTFYQKMKKGIFSSDEIEKMIELLDINNPLDIFFAKNVTL